MKSSELKTVLKPLIKQCIKEVILEEGVLSNIVSEVVQGLGGSRIDEAKTRTSSPDKVEITQRKKQELRETKERMAKAIGTEGYNGVDIFEGVKPLKSSGKSQPGANPLADVPPEDPGVNIDGILKIGGSRWKNLI